MIFFAREQVLSMFFKIQEKKEGVTGLISSENRSEGGLLKYACKWETGKKINKNWILVNI